MLATLARGTHFLLPNSPLSDFFLFFYGVPLLKRVRKKHVIHHMPIDNTSHHNGHRQAVFSATSPPNTPLPPLTLRNRCTNSLYDASFFLSTFRSCFRLTAPVTCQSAPAPSSGRILSRGARKILCKGGTGAKEPPVCEAKMDVKILTPRTVITPP